MKKILVIDDDELVRNMVCNSLRKSGFTVCEAQNGYEGVNKAQSEMPDLVITDILMPDKEGIETILEIRAANKNTRIIAMSGGGSTHNMAFLDMAKKVGAQQVLSKPFKPTQLLEAVATVLKQ